MIGQRLRPKKRIAKTEADFLLKHAHGPFKLALPSPVNFAVIFWRQGVSDRAYKTPSEFLSDAAHILASEARALAGEGTPYLQLDAPLYTHWADGSLKAKYAKLGFDMDRFLDDAIAAENAILDAAARRSPASIFVAATRWGDGWLRAVTSRLQSSCSMSCAAIGCSLNTTVRGRATSRRCVMSLRARPSCSA